MLLLPLRAGVDLLQRVGGAGGPHRPEHVAVVGERVHPGHGHLSRREQILVGVLHVVVLQGETETAFLALGSGGGGQPVGRQLVRLLHLLESQLNLLIN